MEFGDKEWFKKLNERTSFPGVFAFYVSSDGLINSQEIKTKAENLGNLKYKTVEPPILFGGINAALANVKRCKTDQEYYEECKRLTKIWK